MWRDTSRRRYVATVAFFALVLGCVASIVAARWTTQKQSSEITQPQVSRLGAVAIDELATRYRIDRRALTVAHVRKEGRRWCVLVEGDSGIVGDHYFVYLTEDGHVTDIGVGL